ncbi:hypothetical protein LTR37_004381 [Vermiconidia calcicola]|uniref:Uncharacterized protein n=1 Tax=Vermiconidia calcicola TaxID=1690605 RepID=A0ACC3NMR8_9PEZI|nr:hypothetical protein LTR37_004381 [Vermiconidia calcicola]
MKRKASPTKTSTASKKPRPSVPEYHLTPSIQEEDGSTQWPAPRAQIERAREIVRTCANAKARTLIVPDKDADGLSAGAILRHTLTVLGLPKEMIDVHVLTKGNTIHTEEERVKMASHSPRFVFVLDQGSRSGPPVIDGDLEASLVIDHHHATEKDFPKGASFVTACHSPPVATSALLTYLLCEPLHPGVRERCDWLCVVGTHGDLGNTLKWEPPFPDMQACLKKYTKKVLNDVVSLVNAPRRTATYDVRSAWDALCDIAEPASVLKSPRLLAARSEVNAEVERCTHVAPKFSPDGKIAVLRIKSEAQVHPVIATRWSGHLQSKALEIVLVANEGYLPGKVNFSCRIPRCARSRDPPVDIIASLKAYASLPVSEDAESIDAESRAKLPLLERLGEDFARGHVQASGGIVTVDEFEELMRNMRIGEKQPKKEGEGSPKKQKSVVDSSQKNNLMNYFGKAAKT